jgi:hypothetical protein
MRYAGIEKPRSLFHGGELMRLSSMITFMALLAMLMVRFRDPGMWTWLADDAPPQQSGPQSPAPPPGAPAGEEKPVPSVPAPAVATGPTDEDPDEADAAREEYQAIADGSLGIQPEEMISYKRVLRWVENQPYEGLRKRARTDLVFTQFYQRAEEYRGQIVALDLNIRRILTWKLGEQTLYEVWGFTTESKAWLYVAIVPEVPPGMAIGPDVYERGVVAGYFYKLQGYHAASSKPNAAPLRAPLLIGRLKGRAVAQPVSQSVNWTWVYGLLGVFAVAVLLGCFRLFVGGRRKPRQASASVAEGGRSPAAVQDWLERCGPVELEAGPGNNFGEKTESGDGKARGTGLRGGPPMGPAGDIDDVPGWNP